MKAILALEDGKVYEGVSFGSRGERYGEIVFNTGMTGYQEILTDPSYKGQIVTMTYPLIGNYGTNPEDTESRGPFVEAFVVKEYSKIASNQRSNKSLGDYLKENDIPAIEGVDTRDLTLHIRRSGAMKAVLSTIDADRDSLVSKAKRSRGLVGVDLVKEVTPYKKYIWNKTTGPDVTVIDCGAKSNISRLLSGFGCAVTVVPADTGPDQILAQAPDGVLISNGPGDPAALGYVVNTARALIGKLPIFGICLGHQIIGQALGAKTYKLKFGHHGANHPVKDTITGRVAITVQNHGFCVDADRLNKKDIRLTHINLNDGTLEGMEHKRLPVFSVQFHPEASPGPHDAEYLFGKFTGMLKKNRLNRKR